MSEEKSYRSPLENHPEYVNALGMITIENASLEVMLAELLGAILGIHLHFGNLLFFTPKAAIPRLELIENVLEPSIGEHRDLTHRIFAILKRTKAAIGKRHVLIHSLWAENEWPEIDDSNVMIARISFPSWSGGDISLTELTDLVRDYRRLIEELGPLTEEVQKARGFGWKRPVQFP